MYRGYGEGSDTANNEEPVWRDRSGASILVVKVENNKESILILFGTKTVIGEIQYTTRKQTITYIVHQRNMCTRRIVSEYFFYFYTYK